jgi:hypothetical protein
VIKKEKIGKERREKRGREQEEGRSREGKGRDYLIGL